MSSPPGAPRPVRDSASEYSELALPTDANLFGFLLGGRVMHLVDLAGAMAAMRHARCPVVTASVDYMTFLHPIHIGQLVILRSSVNRVFRTSMEVGVKVFVEDLLTGQHGNRIPIPPVIPETEEEKRRFEEAERRRAYRLELKNRARN
jgi:acyl-CoA hydrolase